MRDECPTTISVNDADFASLCLDILSRGNSVRFAALGSSMTPCIRDGEIVTVVPVAAGDLRIGDIVLYRTPGNHLTVHRLISRTACQAALVFQMKGDAGLACRQTVPADRVLGRVVYVENKGRKRRVDTRFRRLLDLGLAAVREVRTKARR